MPRHRVPAARSPRCRPQPPGRPRGGHTTTRGRPARRWARTRRPARGTGQVGVGGRQGERHRRDRRDDTTGRAHPTRSIGQRHRVPAAAPSYGDRSRRPAPVDGRGDRERDRMNSASCGPGHTRAGGQWGELASQRRTDSISTDAAPPTRRPSRVRERRPVRGPGRRRRPGHRDPPPVRPAPRPAPLYRGGGRAPRRTSAPAHGEQHRAATTPVSRRRRAAPRGDPPPIRPDHRRAAHHAGQEAPADRRVRPSAQPAAAYPATPPAPGNRVPTRVNTEASAPDTTSSLSQARMERRPGSAAASPGSSNSGAEQRAGTKKRRARRRAW